MSNLDGDPPQWFILAATIFLGVLVLCGCGSGIYLFVKLVNYYLS